MGVGHWVISLDSVASAMDAAVREAAQPFDMDCVAFLAAHTTRDVEIDVNALAAHHGTTFPAMSWLRILARLQTRFAPEPMTALAKWLVTQSEPLMAGWHNRDRRAALARQLAALAEEGFLPPIVAALDDRPGLEADAAGTAAAVETLAHIDAELDRIANGGAERAALAVRYGLEATVGLGLIALAVCLAAAVFG